MFSELVRRMRSSRLANARFLFAAPLAYAPGHFYSPICDPAELRRRYRDASEWTAETDLPGIDMAAERQLEMWRSWEPYLQDARSFAVDDPARRYRLPSASYDVGDAIIYVCMLRGLQPRRLMEVGSGSSSAVALDAFDRFFMQPPSCVFIDPYPELLRSLLSPEDMKRVDIIPSAVQDVAPSCFETLERGDLLFIDSTHIVKTGSDVVYELFEILPRLRPGVVVHFHDAFYPFEYPSGWVLDKNYSWNELYALHAFLMNNSDWEIIFFNDYFARAQRREVERAAPEILRNPGGGLWLRRR